MREIKFRAWDSKEKKYDTNFYMTNKGEPFDYLFHIEWIDDYVIEQFTGLLDKNGKEIYEGDIVKYDTPPENGVATISSYIGNSLYFCWHNSPTPPTNADIFGRKDELEVIGNIHENPELLEATC